MSEVRWIVRVRELSNPWLQSAIALLSLVALTLSGCDLAAPPAAGIDPLPGTNAAPTAGVQATANSSGASPSALLPALQPLPGLSAVTYPSTPQAVFEQARAAANSHQWQQYVQYLSPDSINVKFTAYMESAVTWDERSIGRAADPRLQELASRLSGSMQALFAALDARGISREMLAEAKFDPDAKNRLLERIPDKATFIADVMARGGGKVDGNLLGNFRAENWQVQEELATVDLVAERNGRELRLPLEVKKIDGKWKLEM